MNTVVSISLSFFYYAEATRKNSDGGKNEMATKREDAKIQSPKKVFKRGWKKAAGKLRQKR